MHVYSRPMDDPVPSRVAKTTLFDLFHQVCHKFGRKDLATLNYVKAKKSAATFQRMKSFVGQYYYDKDKSDSNLH